MEKIYTGVKSQKGEKIYVGNVVLVGVSKYEVLFENNILYYKCLNTNKIYPFIFNHSPKEIIG